MWAKRYGVSLPAHHPSVAWLVRHCAWLHDRFVMKRQDQQTPFQRQMAQCFGENQDLMCSNSRKSGVSASGRTRQLGRYAHHFDKTRSFDRQINPQARASEAADQQLLLAVKGHPGRLKAMTDEPEVLPLPPAPSSTPIRLPESAAAQDMAAEPAPATPAVRSGREQAL